MLQASAPSIPISYVSVGKLNNFGRNNEVALGTIGISRLVAHFYPRCFAGWKQTGEKDFGKIVQGWAKHLLGAS